MHVEPPAVLLSASHCLNPFVISINCDLKRRIAPYSSWDYYSYYSWVAIVLSGIELTHWRICDLKKKKKEKKRKKEMKDGRKTSRKGVCRKEICQASQQGKGHFKWLIDLQQSIIFYLSSVYWPEVRVLLPTVNSCDQKFSLCNVDFIVLYIAGYAYMRPLKFVP